MNDETLGQRVKRIRENNGMTIDDLSVLADVSKQYISNIENDLRTKNPSVYRIHDIAKALNVTVEYLVTGEEVSVTIKDDPLAYLTPELREIYLELLDNKGGTYTYFRKQAKELDREGLTSILEFIKFCKQRSREKRREEELRKQKE